MRSGDLLILLVAGAAIYFLIRSSSPSVPLLPAHLLGCPPGQESNGFTCVTSQPGVIQF